MTDWSPDKEDAVMNAAKKGGKKILTGISKGGLHFTKRIAEGAFNAQMASKQHKETGDKIKAAGSELGRAFIKGAIEGATETLSGVISGVNEFSKEMNNVDDTNDKLPEGNDEAED